MALPSMAPRNLDLTLKSIAAKGNRTPDTRIFSPLLYRLSYSGETGVREYALRPKAVPVRRVREYTLAEYGVHRNGTMYWRPGKSQGGRSQQFSFCTSGDAKQDPWDEAGRL